MRSNRKKVYCNSTNSIIYKLFLLHNRNLVFSKDFISYLSLFCIFACFFVVFIGIDDKYGEHNIIDIAWADEINGIEQANDILTGGYGTDIFILEQH